MARVLSKTVQFTESEIRNGIRAEATANLGHKYRDSAVPTNWPPEQFDCSTFVRYCMTKFGIDPDPGKRFVGVWPEPEPKPWRKYVGYTMTQLNRGKQLGAEVAFADIEIGDALYYSDVDGKPYHHTVIYAGNGKIIQAAGTAYGVIASNVLPPGKVGHGNKKFVGAISCIKLAKKLGVWKADPVTPAKPPATKPPVTPPTGATVSLSKILASAKADIPAKDGHKTYPADVLLVEKALRSEGFLGSSYTDGSWGTMTRDAYSKWQKKLGYKGADADGTPGVASLTQLGKKYGFKIVA